MCGSRETRQHASSPPTTTPAFRCCNASTGVFSHELTANSNSVTSQPPHELINKRNNKYTHALRLTHNGPQIAAPVVQTITSGRTIVTGHNTQYTHARQEGHAIPFSVWCGVRGPRVKDSARCPLLALPTNVEEPPTKSPQFRTNQCKITPPTHHP